MSSPSLDLARLRYSKGMPTLYFRGQTKVFDLHPTGMRLWQQLAENTYSARLRLHSVESLEKNCTVHGTGEKTKTWAIQCQEQPKG